MHVPLSGGLLVGTWSQQRQRQNDGGAEPCGPSRHDAATTRNESSLQNSQRTEVRPSSLLQICFINLFRIIIVCVMYSIFVLLCVTKL